MKNIIVMIFTLFCFSNVLACDEPDLEWSRTLNSDKHIIKGPYTIKQLEKSHMIEIRETKQMLPFGYNNEAWEQLKATYKPGDKIFHVKFQDGTFFVEHHVLVRENCIVGAMRGEIS